MLPETQTIVVPLICGIVFIISIGIYSMCKVAARADAHIEAVKQMLNEEHELQDRDQSS